MLSISSYMIYIIYIEFKRPFQYIFNLHIQSKENYKQYVKSSRQPDQFAGKKRKKRNWSSRPRMTQFVQLGWGGRGDIKEHLIRVKIKYMFTENNKLIFVVYNYCFFPHLIDNQWACGLQLAACALTGWVVIMIALVHP